MLLVEVQDQLQAIVSSQAQLLREADTASHTLNSQLSDISQSQMRSKDTVDHINLQIASMDRKVQQLQESSQSISGLVFDQLAGNCLKALYVTDPDVDRKEIETRRGKLIDKSCDWILPQFRAFLENDSASRLWIHGTPGKGKTMISMALVDELLSRVDSDPSSLCGYFFCDNMSDKRNTVLAVMKTLLYRFLQAFLESRTEAPKKFLRSFGVKGKSM